MQHGKHWASIYKNHEKQLAKALRKVVDEGEVLDEAPWPDDTRPPDDIKAGSLLVMSEAEGSLRHLIVLLQDKENREQKIWTSYPFAPGGMSYDVHITGVQDWENGAEGQVSGRVKYVGRVTFFDTLFWLNRKSYTLGATYKMYLSAIAHEIGPAEDAAAVAERLTATPAIADMRQQSAESGRANLPATKSAAMPIIAKSESGEVDEYDFLSPVRYASEFPFGRNKFHVVGITLMQRGTVTIDIDLYVAPHLMPKRYTPHVGDYVTGRLWLQGHMVI